MIENKINISIITVCLNSENVIQKNIQSVKDQNFDSFEHIFIDGCSEDRTCEIINRYAKNYKLIIEKDEGIFDAMNKGIKESSGNVICFLNSDDYFINNEILNTAAKELGKNQIDNLILGFNISLYNEKNNSKFLFKSKISSKQHPLYYNQLPHPGMFIKTKNTNDLLFNKKYKIGADLHQQMKLFFKLNYEQIFLNQTSTVMLVGGASSGSLSKYINNFKESRQIYNEIFGSKGLIFATIRFAKNLFRRFSSVSTFFK